MRSKDNLQDLFPLTPIQQGILVHAIAGDDDPYLLRACFRIDGAIDAAALHRAWQRVVDRHEALRADVEWTRSKQPVLMVFRACPVTLAQLDWRDVAPAELDARLRAEVDAEARRFALPRAADPRVVLIRTAADRSYLIWVCHHLLLDGWSIANVLAEVLRGYHALLTGGAAEPAPVTPYASYLAWLRGRPAASAETYWRDALAGHEPPEFPPRVPGGAGFAERTIVLDDAASARLRALAADARVTLSTCMHAVHALWIAAFTGHDDVAFGATVAGRPAELPGVAAMVGAFINTVPIRVRVPARGELIGWLQRLQADAGQRVAHEHLGLPRIQELAGQAVFASILVVENFPIADVLGQADALPIAVEQHRLFDTHDGVTAGRGRNNYPLTLVVLPGARLELIIAYHRDRVSDALAAALADRLTAIMHAVIDRASLAALHTVGARPIPPIATPATPQLIHERISGWARATPDAIAVRCDDETVSYAALDARADRLAAKLQAAGVTPGARVGLALPRTPELVVALLAVLKAGAAYVPFDPDAPRARLAELVADAALAAVIGALDGASRVTLDDAPGTPARVALDPEAPAYVIYTSGSTGTPKGVVISHRALDHYVTSIVARLSPAATASMAMASTVAADLGHTALFGALCTGGTLHLISDERAADPDGFASYLAHHQVAALKIVPGHLWGLMQTATPARALPAHTLILGGEAAPPGLLALLRAQTRCRVLNHYGPTETTVGVLTHALTDDDPVPLGHPLPHAQAHVLGPDLRPLPPGAAGEIYLGGHALAAGYWRRPALTAARFVPDPLSGRPGARLYRTGDRGRMRHDGAIDFLGRADDQIKLRGFRVELGEIRAELLRVPGVRDARVIARPGPAGSPQLCAYLIGSPDSGDIASALRERLPEPMIPAAFVWLERLPVTPNGKLDVARLPVPADPARPSDDEPIGELEQLLATIWCEVLRCPAVRRDDHFFHLGGDSILALKVVARARRAGFKLTPKQLFAHPTLAAAARVAQPIEPPISTPTYAPPPDVALTPIQLHFLARQIHDPHHYNQAVLLALDAPLALDALTAALDQLTRHHDALRLRFTRDGARWRAYQAEPGDPRDAVTRVDLRDAADPAAAITHACDELQRSVDLARGPLLRAAYLDLGPAHPPRLLLYAHHLVVDGVSWRILLEDLAELLRPTPALAPPTTTFAEWSARLRGHSATLGDEVAYWQRITADPPPARVGSNTVGDAETVSAALDATATDALLHRAARAHDATVHELLLAAVTRTLARAWDRATLTITVEGHGREDVLDGVDLSRTVGWLATTYPVRLTALPDRAATVRGVADQLRAVPARGLGYGLLRHLAPGAPLAHLATPDVTLNYLGQFDDSFADQAFHIASEPSGQRRSPRSPRDGWFVINAVVYDGTLRVDWEYSRALHTAAEVAPLLAALIAELHALISEAP